MAMNPIHFNRDPIFWISGKDEPNAPSVGEGDESPSNLALSPDIRLAQNNRTSRPIWKNGYWLFNPDNNLLWNNPTFPESVQTNSVTYAGVGYRSDSSSLSRGISRTLGNGSMDIGIEETNSARFSVDVTDPDGNNIFVSNTGIDIFENLYAWVLKINLSRDTVFFKVIDEVGNVATGETTSAGFGNKPFEIDNLRIGEAGGTNDYDGRIYEFQIYDEFLNENEVNHLLGHLLDKYDISSNAKTVPVYPPNSIPGDYSFRMDGKNEPKPPAVGNSHEQPVNLGLNESRVFRNLTSGRPDWGGNGWTFDNDEDQFWGWEGFENDPQEITWAIVTRIGTSAPNSFNGRVGIAAHRDGPTFIEIFYDYNNDRILFAGRQSDPDDGTNYNAFAIFNPFPVDEKVVLVPRFKQFKGAQRFELEMDAYSPTNGYQYENGASNTPFTPDFTVDQRYLGANSVNDRSYQGDIYEFIDWERRLSDNEVEGSVIPHLKNKWSV
jgi:hypothetical protein